MGANVGAKIVTILQAVDNIIINGILWRSDRDSNPGDGLPPTHFPGVRLRPLGHRSVGGCLDGLWDQAQGVF